MNIRLDYPNKAGSGNTNNGNLGRTAFSKPEILAEILELDLNLSAKKQLVCTCRCIHGFPCQPVFIRH